MTRDHARKQAIRARMAATGEPYNVAARALDNPDPNPHPAADPNPGAHPEPPAHLEPGAGREPGAGQEPSAAAPGDPDVALAAVVAAATWTLSAASARLVIQSDTETGRDPEPAGDRRPGLVGRLARRAVRRLLGPEAADVSMAEILERVMHQYGAGFIEPAAGRYLVDFGGYAEMLADGRRYGGLSGQPLAPRHEQRPRRNRRDDPFDGLRKLQRATAASWAGTERVRWATCRVAAVTVGPDELTVWLNGERVQRFRTVCRGSGRSEATTTETTELWDYGVPLDELDWTCLPAFRTDRAADRIIERDA